MWMLAGSHLNPAGLTAAPWSICKYWRCSGVKSAFSVSNLARNATVSHSALTHRKWPISLLESMASFQDTERAREKKSSSCFYTAESASNRIFSSRFHSSVCSLPARWLLLTAVCVIHFRFNYVWPCCVFASAEVYPIVLTHTPNTHQSARNSYWFIPWKAFAAGNNRKSDKRLEMSLFFSVYGTCFTNLKYYLLPAGCPKAFQYSISLFSTSCLNFARHRNHVTTNHRFNIPWHASAVKRHKLNHENNNWQLIIWLI